MASVFFLRDKDHYLESTMELLDCYCNSITEMFEKPQYLMGGALAMRKSLELMGMYLQIYRSTTGRPLNISGEGADVFDRKGKSNDGQKKKSNPYLLVANAVNTNDVIVNELFELHDAISTLLHYQGYRYAEDFLKPDAVGNSSEAQKLREGLKDAEASREKTRKLTGIEDYDLRAETVDEAEIRSLKYDFQIMNSQLPRFASTLGYFVNQLKEDAASQGVSFNKGGYPSLQAVLSIKMDNESTSPCTMVSKHNGTRKDFCLQEAYRVIGRHKKVGRNVYLSYACEVLGQCKGKHGKYTDLHTLDTAMVWSRKVSEKAAYCLLAKEKKNMLTEDKEKGQKKQIDAELAVTTGTFDLYCQQLKDLCGECDATKKREIHKALLEYQAVNSLTVYWTHVQPVSTEILCYTDDKTKSRARTELETRINPYSGGFVKECVLTPQPDSVREWINQHEVALNELRRKLAYHKIAVSILFVAVLVLLMAVLGMLYDSAQRQKFTSEYYADYGWQDGIPVGINKLTDEEAAQGLHYVLTYNSQNQLVYLAHKDGNNQLRNEYILTDRPALMKFVYDEDDKVYRIVAYDDMENTLASFLFSITSMDNYYRVDFLAPNGIDALTLPMNLTNFSIYDWQHNTSRSTIERAYVSREENGTTRIAFVQTLPSTNPLLSMTYHYDILGRLSNVSYELNAIADTDSTDLQIENRLVSRWYVYDPTFRLQRREDVDQSGTAIRYTYNYDLVTGQCSSITLSDITGQTLETEDGIAVISLDYDTVGRLRAQSRVSAQEQTVEQIGDYASRVWDYDDEGRLTAVAYQNPQGQLYLSSEGWAKYTIQYDSNVKTVAYFGVDGQFVNIDGGDDNDYAIEEVTTNGDMQTIIRYDANYERVAFSGDVYEWRRTYKDENIVREEAYGKDCQPVLAYKVYGDYFCMISEYEGDRLTREIHYLLDGKTPSYRFDYVYEDHTTYMHYYRYSTETNSYYYSWTMRTTYDDRNREKEWMAFLKENNGILERFNIEAGFSYMENQYDEEGRFISNIHLDADGQPAVCSECGYASLEYVYDPDTGDLIEWRYWDADAQLMDSGYGYAGLRQNIADGHVIMESYYDEQERLVIPPDKSGAIIRWIYNERGERIETQVYDVNGWLIGDQSQWITLGSKRDFTVHDIQQVNGKSVSRHWEHYDCYGRLAPLDGTNYASGDYFYDEEGVRVSEDFFDIEGKLFLVRSYDKQGRTIDELWVDEERHLVMNEELGYAEKRIVYLENGRTEEWFDAAGTLIGQYSFEE